MILLYVVLAIVIFVVLLLFLPMNLIINYDKKMKIVVKILGIKLGLPEKSKQAALKIGLPKKEKEKQKKPKKSKKKRSLAENLSIVLKLLKTSKNALTDILAKININDFTLKLKIGGKDASSVAITYGQASGVVYSIFNLLNSVKPIDNYEVFVSPDFLSEKTSALFNLEVSLKPFYLIAIALKHGKKINEILNYEGD